MQERAECTERGEEGVRDRQWQARAEGIEQGGRGLMWGGEDDASVFCSSPRMLPRFPAQLFVYNASACPGVDYHARTRLEGV